MAVYRLCREIKELREVKALRSLLVDLAARAGRNWPVRSWLSMRCRVTGARLTREGKAVQLEKRDRIIRLASKHAIFAPEVCRNFEAFAYALPARVSGGMSVVDFEAEPDVFNWARQCLRHGVTITNRGEEIWLRKDSRAMVLSPQHLIYSGGMAEKFELYFAPLVPEEREGLQVLDYSRPGRLQTYKSGLQFEMASFPEEEEAIEEYFHWCRPKAGDLVFDVGAHCGVSTYHLAKLVGPEGRVVAFEPDPVNFGILKNNIERHGLTNVIAENAAIAGTAGELGFNSEGTIGSSLVSVMQRESVGSTVMVKAVTLADAFERWGTPAFCKIDIEGAEVDVLAKSGEVLRRHRTHFALDTHHPKPNGEMTNRDVETMFRSYGYEVASEANPLWTTWARPIG